VRAPPDLPSTSLGQPPARVRQQEHRCRTVWRMTETAPLRVAIACQGGGSHTAFTAGVLKRLLGAQELAGVEIVGLSGTSGGAVCALLAWSALLDNDPPAAGVRLEAFWADNSASTPLEQLVNAWVLWAARLENLVALPAVSPYDTPTSVQVLSEFRAMLERRVDFDQLAVKTDQAGVSGPMLLLGAVDVLSGDFRAFNSHREPITAEMVLASAAIPNLFRAVRVDGGTYWDGLFSQNPPVRELVDTRPDELWVIQINPGRRDREPRTVVEIADRRNELAGNLSLHQELRFIEKVDQLLEEGRLTADGKYKQIVVRLIELRGPRCRGRSGPPPSSTAIPASSPSCWLTARPRPRSSWPRWPSSGPGGTATRMPCSAASPTTPSCGRRRRSLTAAACAAASGSDALCASISPPTCMSTRPASRWPGTGSAGRCRPGGTIGAGGSWGTPRPNSGTGRS